MTIEQLYELYQQHPSVQTDTRKLQAGDIFFALSGPNFNGNLFALKALEQGASYAIVDEDIAPGNHRILLVKNVLETLQQLAKQHRIQFNIPVIAITGSNGKTTTKELVHTVLSSQYITYTTKGNLNNHIGIPLTLLGIRPDAQMAIVEMGANHQKEIEGYCQYTLPTHGIITNCGKAHLEGFGGVEGVRKGKGELFDYLRLNKGTAFIFNDYDYLHQMSEGLTKVVYGTATGATLGHVKQSDPFLQVQIQKPFNRLISTQLVGDYNLPNILCAVAAGNFFNIEANKILNALEQYLPDNSRSQMVVKGTNHIILDAYNANPSSMAAAIKNIVAINAENKMLLLGGMMELGEESIKEHQALLDLIGNYTWKEVVLVGGDFSGLTHPYRFFKNVLEAAKWYKGQHFHNTCQLIKGSRSMQMEKILNEAYS